MMFILIIYNLFNRTLLESPLLARDLPDLCSHNTHRKSLSIPFSVLRYSLICSILKENF